jgi:hypothetical protein
MLEDEAIFHSLNEGNVQPRNQTLTYISRIECMQAAIQIQLEGIICYFKFVVESHTLLIS